MKTLGGSRPPTLQRLPRKASTGYTNDPQAPPLRVISFLGLSRFNVAKPNSAPSSQDLWVAVAAFDGSGRAQALRSTGFDALPDGLRRSAITSNLCFDKALAELAIGDSRQYA
jgi:hypothetical protein